VGGGAGAAIGQEVGGTKGAVIGAGVGGAAGAAIGRDMNRDRKPQTQQTQPQQASSSTTKVVHQTVIVEGRCKPKHGKGWAKGHAKKGC